MADPKQDEGMHVLSTECQGNCNIVCNTEFY